MFFLGPGLVWETCSRGYINKWSRAPGMSLVKQSLLTLMLGRGASSRSGEGLA